MDLSDLLAIQAGRCNRGRSRWQADAVEVGPHGTRLDKRRQDLHATRATGTVPQLMAEEMDQAFVEQLEREGFRVLSRVALGAGDLA